MAHWQGLRDARADRPLGAVLGGAQLVVLQSEGTRGSVAIALDLPEAAQEVEVQLPARAADAHTPYMRSPLLSTYHEAAVSDICSAMLTPCLHQVPWYLLQGM